MDHAVLAGRELDEHAEAHHAHDLAGEHIAHFNVLRNAFDDALGLLSHGVVGGSDVDAAVVLDIDLHAAAVGDDLVDHLAAGPDDFANLLGVDGEADDLGRVGAQMITRGGDSLKHLAQDMQTAFQRLRKRLAEDLLVDTLDLDVHLNGGDAVHRARDLEVHIAEEVLEALDIGQHADLVAVRILNQAHRNAGDRRLDRHARVHQCHGAAAHGSLRRGTVGRKHFAHKADGIREFLFRRDHRQQRALGERSVTDLAAAGALHAAGFTGGIRRHVVVMHVALGFLVGDAVEDLHFAHRAQRGDGHHLRFAAGEHGGTVRTRQHAHFAPDGANLGQRAAVGTNAFLEDAGAHDLFVDVIQRIADFLLAAFELLGEMLERFLLDLLLARLALVTVEGFEDPLAALERIFAHGRIDVLAGDLHEHFALFLADFGSDLLLQRDDGLDLLMSEQNRLEHGFFGNLVRARFDHHHGVLRAGDGQVQVALFALLVVRVKDELAVHKTHLRRADRAAEGDIGNHQSGACADHGRNFRRQVRIHGKHGGHYLHVVAHALGEERAQRTVDQAGSQRGLLRGTAFALDEAAGDLAHGVQLLFKIAAEREEVNAITGLVAHRGANEHGGVAIANKHRAAGLLSVFAEVK